jgi:hypothetical protein
MTDCYFRVGQTEKKRVEILKTSHINLKIHGKIYFYKNRFISLGSVKGHIEKSGSHVPRFFCNF